MAFDACTHLYSSIDRVSEFLDFILRYKRLIEKKITRLLNVAIAFIDTPDFPDLTLPGQDYLASIRECFPDLSSDSVSLEVAEQLIALNITQLAIDGYNELIRNDSVTKIYKALNKYNTFISGYEAELRTQFDRVFGFLETLRCLSCADINSVTTNYERLKNLIYDSETDQFRSVISSEGLNSITNYQDALEKLRAEVFPPIV